MAVELSGKIAGALLAALCSLGVPGGSYAQEPKSCPSIRALDGSCANPVLVDLAKKRASVVSSSFSSYVGTPVGTIGLPIIPYERLFRDNTTLFGLPTYTTTNSLTLGSDQPVCGGTPCTVTTTNRSK